MSRFGVLAVGALLALGACSDNKSAVTSESSTAPTSVSSAPDTTGASDDTVGDTVGDTVVHDSLPADTVVDDTSVDPNAAGFGSDFCVVNDEMNQSDFDPLKATPAETEAYFGTVFPDRFGRAQDSAPDELTADVATVATAFGALISELESNGWDFSAAYAVPAVQTLLTAPEIGTAFANIETYCGV